MTDTSILFITGIGALILGIWMLFYYKKLPLNNEDEPINPRPLGLLRALGLILLGSICLISALIYWLKK